MSLISQIYYHYYHHYHHHIHISFSTIYTGKKISAVIAVLQIILFYNVLQIYQYIYKTLLYYF